MSSTNNASSKGHIPPHGIVSLADKQMPACETQLPYKDDYAFTRAELDVSEFKKYLQNLPSEMWEDEKQQGNVKLHRPAHDAWGIKKIVFTFCDDFLLKVFDLPWSQAEEWRRHLLPIYEALGVPESRVVRCLLASMPPGMKIPVHHDTGLWVKHTHRCHVAIISHPTEVDFFCGPTNDSLRKICFNEGRVVELNNSAKHAVANNMKDTWRVHLILDYVDEHPVNR
jgi:Aspartyl/Asparaginyl beta-hydroxylase